MHVCFTRDLKLNILSWVYNYAYMRDVKREGIWATLSLFMLRTELHCYHSLLLMLTCSFFPQFHCFTEHKTHSLQTYHDA